MFSFFYSENFFLSFSEYCFSSLTVLPAPAACPMTFPGCSDEKWRKQLRTNFPVHWLRNLRIFVQRVNMRINSKLPQERPKPFTLRRISRKKAINFAKENYKCRLPLYRASLYHVFGLYLSYFSFLFSGKYIKSSNFSVHVSNDIYRLIQNKCSIICIMSGTQNL